MIHVLASISVYVFIVFIVLSIVSAVKKNGKLKTFLVFTGVSLALMAVLVSLDPSKPNDKTTVNTSSEKAKEVTTKESNEKKLYKQIKEAADTHFGKVTNIEINDDMGKKNGGKIVLIHVKKDGLSKELVNYNTTKALEKVFKIKKVNEIVYFWEATLVDIKGKERVDTVAKIQMEKETASTIKWENFYSDNLEKVADDYTSSPALK